MPQICQKIIFKNNSEVDRKSQASRTEDDDDVERGNRDDKHNDMDVS